MGSLTSRALMARTIKASSSSMRRRRIAKAGGPDPSALTRSAVVIVKFRGGAAVLPWSGSRAIGARRRAVRAVRQGVKSGRALLAFARASVRVTLANER